MKKRIEYIDILKGLGIVCVLLGHNLVIQKNGLLPEMIRYIIYSFHMPLFFFLSGYVFSAREKTSFFLKKKIRTIVVPMYVFSIVVTIFSTLYYSVLLRARPLPSCKGVIINFLSDLFGTEMFGGSPVLWFLPCLFTSQIILFVLIKIFGNKEKIFLLSLFVLYFIGTLNIRFWDIKLPFMLEKALLAVFFVGIGWVIKNWHSKLLDEIPQKFLPIFVISWIVTLFIKQHYYGYSIGMEVDAKHSALLQITVSMSAIFTLILLFRRSQVIKSLSYIGKNSIIYYGLGDMLAFVPNIFLYNILKIDLSKLGNYSVIFSMFIVLCICMILYPVTTIINNKFGFIVGKKGIQNEYINCGK